MRTLLAQPYSLESLRELTFECCGVLDIALLNLDFLPSCPHLQTLTVTGQPRVHLQYPSVRAPELKTLRLDWGKHNCVRVVTAKLECPQLHSLFVRGLRAYLWLPGTWQLPPSIARLELHYDMDQVELVSILSQLPLLRHLVMSGNKQPHVQLAHPLLRHLDYEINPPHMCVEMQHCPQLHTVELRSSSRRKLPQLHLPPHIPVMRLHGQCHVARGLPAHARRVQ